MALIISNDSKEFLDIIGKKEIILVKYYGVTSIPTGQLVSHGSAEARLLLETISEAIKNRGNSQDDSL